MAESGVTQRDGSELGTAGMLFTGAVVGVLLRGATWVLTAFVVGPVFGLFDLLLTDMTSRTVTLFGQAVLTVAAVVVSVLCGLGLLSEPARYRPRVRLLSCLIVVDVLIYLVPVVAAAGYYPELSTRAWWVFGLATVGNLALAGLAVLIAWRARRLRPAPGQ